VARTTAQVRSKGNSELEARIYDAAQAAGYRARDALGAYGASYDSDAEEDLINEMVRAIETAENAYFRPVA
jgi:hypothetical protein